MKKSFRISGMHCDSCVEKIQSALIEVGSVSNAEVTLNPPRAVLTLKKDVHFESLGNAVNSAGDYSLLEESNDTPQSGEQAGEATSLYPLFLIVAYIAAVVCVAGLSSGNFTLVWLMRQFMAGFFITFSFFKLLDLTGFVSAFRGYDLIAKRYPLYGWSYPFLELGLGVCYLAGIFLLPAYILTILIMGVGAIGVFKVLLDKSSIQCACLGTVLNLPMTKITLVENLSMVIMSLVMLFIHVF